MRKQWHPNCTHAEHRGRLAPLVCDYHRCGVRGKDVYNERDCAGCSSRLPPKEEDETTQEGEIMAGKPGFWSEIHSSGVTNLEHAKERMKTGEGMTAVEKAMRGKSTGSLYAALQAEKKKRVPTQAEIEQEREREAERIEKALERADRVKQPEEPEPPADVQELSVLDAAGAEDLRAFIRFAGLEKRAELALGFAQFRQAG